MLLFALAQIAAPLVVPPPPILTTSSRKPLPGGERVRVGITIRSPEGVLWTGTLWVSGRGTSSWRQSVSEPPAEDCGTRVSYGSDQNELSLGLAPALGDDVGADLALTVTARWVRAAEQPCGGTRSVELRQNVRLTDKEPAIVRGDGGLIVELRRR